MAVTKKLDGIFFVFLCFCFFFSLFLAKVSPFHLQTT